MTPLAAVIRKAGFELTMIRRVGRLAVYRQHFPRGNADHDACEVILPQIRNTDHTGQPVEPYEGYPAPETWGKKGWTFTSLAKAAQRLKEVAQKASCRGTASRRNRLNRRAGITSRPKANGSRPAPASSNFVGRSRQTRAQRQGNAFSGSGWYSVPTTYNLHPFNGIMCSKQHNSAACDATESRRARRVKGLGGQ